MDDRKNNNFRWVSLILVTSVGMNILLNSYSTALYLANFSRSTLPYYFIISAVVSGLSMVFLLPFLAVIEKRPILIAQIAAILLVVLFLILNFWPGKPLALIYTFLFTVLSNIYNANSWNIAASSFELRVFKSYANQFLVLSSVGSILISSLSYGGIDLWGNDFLIYFSLILMIINCSCVYKVQFQFSTFQSKLTSGSLWAYPLFVTLVSFLAFISILSTFANYQMMYRLSQTFDMTEMTKFMTVFFVFINVGTFLTQLYSKQLLEKYGLSVLFFLPTVIICIALIPSILFSGLYVVSVFYGVILILNASIISLGRQVSLNALPTLLKNKGQIFLKSVTNNLARVVASFFLLVFAYRFAFYSYQILSVIFLGFMLYCSWKIKVFYGETLLSTIKEKRFYLPIFEDENDYHFLISHVNSLLSSDDPIKIKIGLSLLKKAVPGEIPQVLYALLEHPDPAIRIKVYKTIAYFEQDVFEAPLWQRLPNETDAMAVWYLLRLIFKKYPKRMMEKMPEYLLSSSPPYQAIAIITAINYGEYYQIRSALEQLECMVHSTKENTRLFAALAMNYIAIGNPVDMMRQLIEDKHYPIAKNAIKASYQINDKRLANILMDQLGRPKVNADAMKSLLKMKIDIAPLLFKTCLREGIHRYKPLIRVLCELHTPTTEACLGRLIPKVPFLFSVELAKQIALRATKTPLSEQLKSTILIHINNIIPELNAYNRLFVQQTDNHIKWELLLRKQLVEKTLICYLAAISKPRSIMDILPKLASKYNSQQINAEHAIALEYLDWLIEDRNLAKKVFESIENKLKINAEDMQHAHLDPWIQTVLHHQLSEGIAMETVDIVFALRQSVIYSHIPAELLISIAEEYQYIELPKGEIIYKVGDYPDRIYLLLSGRVDIFYEGKFLNQVKENEFIGLFTTIAERESPIDIIVSESSTALMVSRNVFEQLIDDYPDMLKEIAKYVIKILFRLAKEKQNGADSRPSFL